MGLDCGSYIAKYVLCIFNLLFFILGTIVLGIGIWLATSKASFIALLKLVENEHLEQFSQPAVIEQLAYILIVIGGIMFILSFLGYCGAIGESKCMLSLYAVFLIILVTLEITAGGLAYAYKDKAKVETKEFLRSTITRYYSSTEKSDAVTLMWNHMMSQMSCCGIDNSKDFEASENWIKFRGNRKVPEACCMLSDKTTFKPVDDTCPNSPTLSNSYLNKGCYDTVSDWIILNQEIVIGVGAGLGIVQLIAIILAFCLCKSIEKYHGTRF